MRTFEQMWDSVGERTTDLIFRMEQLDESFVGSTWSGAEARHDAAPPPSDIADQQQGGHRWHARRRQAAADPQCGSKSVGRNDPCPCGSGKKFKQCHGKRG